MSSGVSVVFARHRPGRKKLLREALSEPIDKGGEFDGVEARVARSGAVGGIEMLHCTMILPQIVEQLANGKMQQHAIIFIE